MGAVPYWYMVKYRSDLNFDRGQAFCLVLYSDGAPSEVLFAGCSYD